jgi:hypothetical protein
LCKITPNLNFKDWERHHVLDIHFINRVGHRFHKTGCLFGDGRHTFGRTQAGRRHQHLCFGMAFYQEKAFIILNTVKKLTASTQEEIT